MRRQLVMAGMMTLALAGCDLLPFGQDTAQVPQDTAVEAPTGLDPAAFEGAFQAIGADGDWRISINPGTGIAFDNIETGELITAAYAPPTREGEAVRIGTAAVSLLVSAGPCTSGAAGVTYPFSVQAKVEGGAVVNGCLYRSWTTQIAALSPAIFACLAVVPGESSVTYVQAERDGMALVRVNEESGAQIDCRAPLVRGEGRIASAPRDMSTLYPGEGDATFYPAPGENPGGECYVAPEVKDATGAVIGWIADPAGC